MKKKLILAAVLAVLAIGPQAAFASTITFDSFPGGGNNSTSFFELQENGYAATVFGTNAIFEWYEAHTDSFLGNPLPAIWTGPAPLTESVQLKVTELFGNTFSFQSVDLAGLGPTAWVFTYYLQGNLVWLNFGDLGSVNYLTYPGAPGVVTDEVHISLFPLNPATSEVSVDNIVLNAAAEPPLPSAVPEPASLVLLSTGLIGVGATIRRRRRA